MLRSARSDNRPADVIGNAVQVIRIATGKGVGNFHASSRRLGRTLRPRHHQAHGVARVAVPAVVCEPDAQIGPRFDDAEVHALLSRWSPPGTAPA